MGLRHSRGSSGRIWLVAVAAGIYVVVLLVSPILHHDLACHIKSPTHCDACVANPLASRIETGVCLGEPALPAAGFVETSGRVVPKAAVSIRTTGRSPPV